MSNTEDKITEMIEGFLESYRNAYIMYKNGEITEQRWSTYHEDGVQSIQSLIEENDRKFLGRMDHMIEEIVFDISGVAFDQAMLQGKISEEDQTGWIERYKKHFLEKS